MASGLRRCALGCLLWGVVALAGAQTAPGAAGDACLKPPPKGTPPTVVRPGAAPDVNVTVECSPQTWIGAAPSASAGGQTAVVKPVVKADPNADDKTNKPLIAPEQIAMLLWIGLGAVGALALGGAALLVYALRQSRENGGIGFNSHWGGFGGSETGWHLTSGAVALIGAAVLVALAVLLVTQMLRPATDQVSTAKVAKATESPPALGGTNR